MSNLATVVKELGIEVHADPKEYILKCMQSGLVVDLHIRRWRATRSRSLMDLGIDWSSLSIDERRAWRDFLDEDSLGTAKLLPRSFLLDLQNLESQGRHNLERWGLTTRWGTFVPAQNLKGWYQRDQALRQQYLALRDWAVQEYPVLQTRLRANYRAWAAPLYRKLYPTENPSAETLDYWCNSYAGAYVAAMPSVDAFAQSFAWEHDFRFLPLPSEVTQSQVEREQILNALAIETEQKRVLLNLVHQQASDARSAKRTIVEHFMQDVRNELSRLIWQSCNEILESFRENKTIVGGNIKALRHLLEKVSQLNVTDDQVIETYLQEVRSIIGTSRPFNQDDSALLAATLQRISLATTETLDAIAKETPRRERMTLAIPLETAPTVVLRRNRSLRLLEDPA